MRFVLLLVAAVIAVVAGVSALKLFSGSEQNAPQVAVESPQPPTANISTVDVIVAREQIPVGTVIKESMITKQPWPSHLVLGSFVVADGQDGTVIGQVARATFMPQEPLIRSKIGNPNDPSFLAAGLPEGVRAITVATDAISGVAGFIFAGDRVDVVITHNMPSLAKTNVTGKTSTSMPAYSEVLVSNVRVLAVNLRDSGLQDSARSTVAPSSVTLAVPEAVVQQIRLAERLGALSLSLRSLKDINEYAVPAPTGLENVTQVGLTSSGASGVRVVRGVKADDEKVDTSTPSLKEVQPTLMGIPTSDGEEE